MTKWEGDIDDFKLPEKITLQQKRYLAKELALLILNDFDYKSQVEELSTYIFDAWGHEGWGDDTFYTDVDVVLENSENPEGIINQFLELGE